MGYAKLQTPQNQIGQQEIQAQPVFQRQQEIQRQSSPANQNGAVMQFDPYLGNVLIVYNGNLVYVYDNWGNPLAIRRRY